MGLNDKEVLENRKLYGSNIIQNNKHNSFLSLLIESLGDPIIKILLIALAIKIIIMFKNFDWYETIGIIIAIFLASFISSISEYGSNKTFERLQNEFNEYDSLVYRNNKLIKIKSSNIVVGDFLKIKSGQRIAADGIIIEGNLVIDESFMSGETKEIYKKKNEIVYSGSSVYKGDAIVKVTNVGINTYMGQISKEMEEKDDESPLKSKLRILAKQISILGYFGAFLAAFSYLFVQIVVNNNFDLELIKNTLLNGKELLNNLIYALTLMVTIIIMAVPEGLPMMITLVLSSNMNKMLKDNILVRKLVGIETSGSLNLLLCDKTGTLTEGKLKVHKILYKEKEIDLNNISNYIELNKLLYLNNESSYDGKSIIGGNSTDNAIMQFIKDYPIKDQIIERFPFDSEKKYSYIKTNNYYYVKGAYENIIDKCNKVEKPLIEHSLNKYTSKGYRVIICAYGKDLNKLEYLGMVVLKDTVRKEAKESLNLIKMAGIQTIMITGDDLNTAVSIAKELDMDLNDKLCLTHLDLEKMNDNDISINLNRISIIARALPQDKSRLVSIAKKNNLIVGMTGDGVNDALALKKSDVSFALGSGCEVAKEASDIVLLDNNIKSICKAILYGRTIFKSIRKFIIYQLTVNICALLLSIIGVLIGVSNPITIVQMLWLNMIMDTFAGLAFSYEPALKKYMTEPPKKKDEKIINSYMINQIVLNGLFSFLICILFLKVPLINLIIPQDKKMTAFFAMFIFLGIFSSFTSRTTELNLFDHISLNKVFIIINCFIILVQILIIYYGGDLFRTYGLSFKELIYVILIAFSIIPFDYLRKRILKKHHIIYDV